MENEKKTEQKTSGPAPQAQAGLHGQAINPLASQIETPHQVTDKMEVHHHPHPPHQSKKWKEYLLEFLMIFLAVTLGFFAESYREHLSEHSKEVEYAKTLYSELLSDSTVIADKLTLRLKKEMDIDFLVAYFRDSSLTSLPKQIYPAFTTSLYLFNTYTFEPKDGMLSQLRNSGSLRFFKSFELQKLLGDLSVNINDIRARNEQEYQFFANPIKPFLLKFYDWNWLNILRTEDKNPILIDVINRYLQVPKTVDAKILNPSAFDRSDACNMVLFYKQMLISTRSLQMNSYSSNNHKVLKFLRQAYNIKSVE